MLLCRLCCLFSSCRVIRFLIIYISCKSIFLKYFKSLIRLNNLSFLIMILAGCDTDGERGFDCWEENLNFALKIQDKAETLYPDMTRPLNFDYFAYNEYVCNGSLLIEVGTESNSIDEATYSGSLLGNAIADVLFKLTASRRRVSLHPIPHIKNSREDIVLHFANCLPDLYYNLFNLLTIFSTLTGRTATSTGTIRVCLLTYRKSK